MTPEEFGQVRDVFAAALDRPAHERPAWLRLRCQGDQRLLQEVERLLAADEMAESGLTLLPQAFPAGSAGGPVRDVPESRQIGHYTILRELGRGGMSVVHLAKRSDKVFSKPVAIKILRSETRDTGLHRRFDQEREIIASLDHPNIARLLDGGTTDEGLPYAVIEYVDGQPIDVYCDERRLNVTDRLALVRAVCGAVQYAHQHLVVHRDLKPSNIFVTPAGTVKLLDFGIAKVLDAGSDGAAAGETAGLRPLTLRYASPEQIAGGRVSTSSDVYSLGVILYELLTGQRPFAAEEAQPHRLIRAVCEDVPPAPSEVARTTTDPIAQTREGTPARLERRLRGEIDTIVMMALRNEPDRRYGSVEKFSEDLRRHLAGLPVAAQADSAAYRARKFVGRNRAGVAAAAMIVLSMAAAIAATSWQARVADNERRRAEEQAAQARTQTERAERQTQEAERYRLRAESEAEFARTQLRIAGERAREAALEREKAERRARSVQAITSALLALEAGLPEVPGGSDIGRRAADEAERGLLALRSEGFDPFSLSKDTAAASELVKRYEERQANVTVITPPGWEFRAENPEQYEHGLDRSYSTRGAVAYIRSRTARAAGIARLMQPVEVSSYIGKRVRVSAWLRSNAVDQEGGLLFLLRNRVVGAVGNQRFLAMHGTNEWSRRSIVFEIDDEVAEMRVGFALSGPGVIWADDFSIEVVDRNTPVTRVLPPAPVDADFSAPTR